METLVMTEGKRAETKVEYNNDADFQLSISQISGDIKLFQEVLFTQEEVIELRNFLNEVLPK